jgi:hypothetical protein
MSSTGMLFFKSKIIMVIAMKRRRKPAIFRSAGVMIVILLAVLILCSSSHAAVWISGSDTINQPGVYGTKGIPHPANYPGARYVSTIWKNTDGNLWFFGGMGHDGNGDYTYLNELWKYNGAIRIWISGSNTGDQTGA